MEITIKRLENAGFKLRDVVEIYYKKVKEFTDIEINIKKQRISLTDNDAQSRQCILEYSEEALVKLWRLFSTEELDFEDKVYTGAEKYWHDENLFPDDLDVRNKDRKLEVFSFEDMIEFADEYAGYCVSKYITSVFPPGQSTPQPQMWGDFDKF